MQGEMALRAGAGRRTAQLRGHCMAGRRDLRPSKFPSEGRGHGRFYRARWRRKCAGRTHGPRMPAGLVPGKTKRMSPLPVSACRYCFVHSSEANRSNA